MARSSPPGPSAPDPASLNADRGKIASGGATALRREKRLNPSGCGRTCPSPTGWVDDRPAARPLPRLEKDMVALKLGGDYEMMAVASPAYFARFGTPTHPRDLHRHRCINWRWPSDQSLYRWEFERGREKLEIAVEGTLIVNDFDLAFRGALAGADIAYGYDPRIEPALAEGSLQRVLKPWSPSFAGLSLYYPNRRQLTATLQAFIDFLRSEGLVRSGPRGQRG